MRGDDFEKPPRIEQLEKICTERLIRLVRHSWSDDLPAALCAGLCLTPRTTWTRHMAEVAWAVRDVEPARAATLARATHDEHERHVAEELERGHLFMNWSDWHDREWVAGLGAALALSGDELDLPKWISTRCRALPLSVWDADESYQAFSTADRAAQIWFLVRFWPRRRGACAPSSGGWPSANGSTRAATGRCGLRSPQSSAGAIRRGCPSSGGRCDCDLATGIQGREERKDWHLACVARDRLSREADDEFAPRAARMAWLNVCGTSPEAAMRYPWGGDDDVDHASRQLAGVSPD